LEIINSISKSDLFLLCGNTILVWIGHVDDVGIWLYTSILNRDTCTYIRLVFLSQINHTEMEMTMRFRTSPVKVSREKQQALVDKINTDLKELHHRRAKGEKTKMPYRLFETHDFNKKKPRRDIGRYYLPIAPREKSSSVSNCILCDRRFAKGEERTNMSYINSQLQNVVHIHTPCRDRCRAHWYHLECMITYLSTVKDNDDRATCYGTARLGRGHCLSSYIDHKDYHKAGIQAIQHLHATNMNCRLNKLPEDMLTKILEYV
jgi:hypothetical protein